MDAGARRTDDYSVKEAAVLSGLSEKALRNELDRGVVRPRGAGRGRNLRLTSDAIFFLMLVRETPFALSRRDRDELYRLLTGSGSARGGWRRRGSAVRRGIVTIDAAATRRELDRRLRLYRRGLARTVSRDDLLGGEPVFAGTRVAVRHVGRLAARGVAVAELLGDFPALTAADIEFARLFAAMKPGPGRPRRRLRLKLVG
jgi:uncharacterized protein (DUF433 family)